MKPLIKNFKKTLMTVGACAQFHEEVMDEIRKATPEALYIEAEMPAYEEAWERVFRIVNRQRSFVATRMMREADNRQCRAYGIIKMVVNAYKSSTVEENRAAAQRLVVELSPYKSLQHEKFVERKVSIGSMLSVLSEPENAAAIATLGLAREVEALRLAHDEVEAAVDYKIQEMAELVEQRDIDTRQATTALNAVYEHIVQLVSAHAIVHPTPALKTFIKRVNSLVSMSAETIARSTGGGEAED